MNTETVVFKTESGSTYRVNYSAETWERLEHAPESKYVRTKGGHFDEISEIQVGRSVTMVEYGGGLSIPGSDRMIRTTRVIEFEHSPSCS